MRLDAYLFSQGKAASRSRAANLIALGRVKINGTTVVKASADVKEGDEIEVEKDYGASLGGMKLEFALEQFSVSPDGRACLDVGASNGGFTDVLLRSGADKVYALDVGECALPQYLREDGRVVVMDRTNARFVKRTDFASSPSLAVIDVSFISVTLVLRAIADCLTGDGEIVVLIKPQFESAKRDLSKRGILTDAKKRAAAVKKVSDFGVSIGLHFLGALPVPHPFAEKNVEYVAHFKKQA